MTTNAQKAQRIVGGVIDRLTTDRSGVPVATRITQALADADLLMPDLPKPDSKGGWKTEFIGAGKGFFAVRTPGVVDFVSSAGVYSNSSEMIRREALRMLAAANYAEQEQGYGRD